MTRQLAAYFLGLGLLILVTSCSLATKAQGQCFRGPDGRMYCTSPNCSQPNRSAGVYVGGSLGVGVGVQRSQSARVIQAIPRPTVGRTVPQLTDLPLPGPANRTTRPVVTTQPKPRPKPPVDTTKYVTQGEHRALLDVVQTLQAELDRLKARLATLQEKLVPIAGEQGEQGLRGQQGLTGERGLRGEQGLPGVVDYSKLPPLPVRQLYMKRKGTPDPPDPIGDLSNWEVYREQVTEVYFGDGEELRFREFPLKGQDVFSPTAEGQP